jgi:hypothetical protein
MGRTLLGADRFFASVAGCVCRPGKFGRLPKARRHPSARGPGCMPILIVAAATKP